MLEKKNLRKLSKNLTMNPDNYMDSFRKNIAMYIEQKDISLAEIAEESDLSVSTLRSFLYGTSTDCHLGLVVKLAKTLNVSCDELVGCGTISPQTCESLQLTRQLPESFTYFVRWMIHYHYDMINSQQVTDKAIEVMLAECGDNGNLKMTNNFEILDISNLDDGLRPKIFMGIKIPCEHYIPNYFPGDILLMANDRIARDKEHVVVNVSDNMWILSRKSNPDHTADYYSIRNQKFRACEDDLKLLIGYVAKVIRNIE